MEASYIKCKRLEEIIESYKDEMIKETSALVEIPSVTDNRLEVEHALKYALNLGERLGFKSSSMVNDEVGTIESEEPQIRNEVLGILTHVDVVNEGDTEKWENPPFKATLKSGKLYGRGTLDDKGPLVASLYAMKAVDDLAKEAGIKPFKKVQMIIGTREETNWTDMYAYVKDYPLPDYGFTPDGEFPICNIEKGVASLTINLPPVLDKDLTYLKGGTASNVVPGRCELILAGEKILIEGKAVHASEPERGENAILKAANYLMDKIDMESQGGKIIRAIRDYFTDREGSALGLRSESEYYGGEFVHRNIFTPTMIEATEEKTILTLDIRYAYGTNFDEIFSAFENFANSLGGIIAGWQDLPPVYVSSKMPFLEVFAQAYEKMTNLKNEFVLAYGGSYAKAMPNIVSWGPIFPGDPDTCHEENEFISVDTLLKNAKIFAAAVWGIVMKEESFII